ncbi:MAG: DUF1311 domain-containing protein [Chitinophagaceae bacterium]|nr:MAG: DUF1311 domain-containing protein [Chitinophagaceae bacterium]
MIRMRPIFLIVFLLSGYLARAQDAGELRAFTVSDEKQLHIAIEKAVTQLRQSLLKEKTAPPLVEITLDTFRVERYLEHRMQIDYSTAGMRLASLEAAHRYDSLLNKYYRRLLQTLRPADRPTLVAAQKAWIAFRDAEMKLVSTMSKEEYSGGGTLQQLIDTDAYYQFVRGRALAIIGHLTRGLEE